MGKGGMRDDRREVMRRPSYFGRLDGFFLEDYHRYRRVDRKNRKLLGPLVVLTKNYWKEETRQTTQKDWKTAAIRKFG